MDYKITDKQIDEIANKISKSVNDCKYCEINKFCKEAQSCGTCEVTWAEWLFKKISL